MDHYEVLGVSPNAENAEINNAFRRKSNAIKPVENNNITRRYGALRNASKAKRALQNSYNLLKNKDRRAKYNKTRKTVNTGMTAPVVVESDINNYKIVSYEISSSKQFPSPQEEVDGIGKSLAIFSKNISEELKKGYSPLGTPFYLSVRTHQICQALIKDNRGFTEMIIIPVIFNDTIDPRIFPLINEEIVNKKGFKPYETPIRIRSTDPGLSGLTKTYMFQAFIK